MKSENDQDIIDEIKQILDAAYADNSQNTHLRTLNAGIQRRRRFATGLMLSAPFCGSMAALGGVMANPFATAFFFFTAVVFFIIGGWQLDKANKEGDDATSVEHPLHSTKTTSTASVRRIK